MFYSRPTLIDRPPRSMKILIHFRKLGTNYRLRYDGSRPGVQSASLYDNFCKTGNDVIDDNDVIIWVQDGNCKKMARENLSIGAFYNITKNQDNPIKTVGRDSFLSPKTHKKFLGVTQPPGVAQPLYSRGHNQTQTYNICPSLIEIGSKTVEKNFAQTI